MELKNEIIYIPDFPVKGILFRDLSPLWEQKELFRKLINSMSETVAEFRVNHLVALEARGFIIASALAYKMGLGLSLIRKQGKLPGEVYRAKYENEYTFTGEVEMQRRSLLEGGRVLLVDDILATGKSSVSCARVIGQFPDVQLVGAAYVLELRELKGRELLSPYIPKICSLIQES